MAVKGPFYKPESYCFDLIRDSNIHGTVPAVEAGAYDTSV